MKYRAFMFVCLLAAAAAFAPARAQGVVVESVDEDVVEGDAPPAAVDKKAVSDKNAVKDSVSNKKAAAEKKSPADTSAAQKKTPAKKELDLDALLGADDKDDLLVEEEKAAAPVAADSASAADTSAKQSDLVGDEKAPAPDSAAQAVQGRRGRPSAPRAAKADTANLGPVVIEDGRSINFAHNLKEYRSPRIAMLLSLLVPGLGQAYSRSYIKAGAFGAAELAAIGVAVYFNSVGNSKKREAYSFADKHFDTTLLKNYGNGLRSVFEDTTAFPEIDTAYLPYANYDTSFYNAARDKQSYFYERIRDGEFTPGWIDSDPKIDKIIEFRNNNDTSKDTIYGDGKTKYVLTYPDTEIKTLFYLLTRVTDKAGNPVNNRDILAYSDNQAEYNSMMDKSKSYYDAVNYMWYVLLVNHIASAIDAGFTARAYNAKLLGQESVWNRLSVEQMYVYSGSEVSPGIALRWRF